MPLYHNSTQVKKITYNGNDVKTCNYNGTKVFSSGPAWYDTVKNMSVGGTVTIDGYVWILVNKTSTAAVLGLSTIYMKTASGIQWGDYSSSGVARWVSNFEKNALSAETKQYLNNVTTSGVTAKCFVPTYDQMNGGFSYYNSDKNRQCKYNGSYDWYWTSTPYGNFWEWYVYKEGHLGNDDSHGSERGVRPHMEVNLTL